MVFLRTFKIFNFVKFCIKVRLMFISLTFVILPVFDPFHFVIKETAVPLILKVDHKQKFI